MGELNIVIQYTPYPKQYTFHTSDAQECVYGGARGGGKSKALTMDAVLYAVKYPKSKVYLFRKTFDELESNLIDELFKVIPEKNKENPHGMFTYDKTKHTATFTNGSRIYFRYISNKEDAKKYQGREMDYCGVDELTQHAAETIQMLLSSLRSPLGYPPKFRGTCNPGGIGHYWTKKRYVDSTTYGKKIITDDSTGGKIQFIQAFVTDNITIMENDKAYVERLKNLPPELRKAWLFGDWEIFEDQVFSEFRLDIHTCDPFDIPAHWRRWRSCDNGYSDPFAFLWYAVDEEGTIHVYREYTRAYGEEKILYSEQAKKVIELSVCKVVDVNGNVSYEQEKIDFTATGIDAWSCNPLTKSVSNPRGKSIMDHYNSGGLNDCIRAITDRKARCAAMHEMLRVYVDGNTGKERSKIIIHRCCKTLIETIPLQVIDIDDIEKYKDTNYDHCVDSWGYGLLAYHADRSKPEKDNLSSIAQHKQNVIKRMHKKRIS